MSNPGVDDRLAREKTWGPEMRALREIVLACGLDEALKWGQACYALDGKNIVLIHGFKDYCALLFFKGALMRDPGALLIQQTQSVQSGRQLRFTSLPEIVAARATVTAYFEEAIAVERAGLSVAKATPAQTPRPAELDDAFTAAPALQTAFEALTPGRQRGYLLHFNAAKQAKTRIARIEKYAPLIAAGKGLDD